MTDELLDVTGQVPITELLSRHRVRWQPAGPIPLWTNNCCFRIPTWGTPFPLAAPLHVDGWAMQDLNILGPRLQLDLLRDWPKLAYDRDAGFAEGVCQPVLAKVLVVTGRGRRLALESFSFSL